MTVCASRNETEARALITRAVVGGEAKPHVGRSLKLHAVTLSDLKGHSMKNSFKKCQELPQGPSHREDPRTPDKSLCFSPFSFLGIIPESTF